MAAHGGWPAHRYTPQLTQRWPRGSEPASPQTDHHPRPGPPPSDRPRQGPRRSPGLVWPTRELDRAHRQGRPGPSQPGKGLHEAMVDLVLWRARQHAQGQHVWIPPVEWSQALTHDTDTNVTRRGTTRLRRAPAEKHHPADPNHPEQWEQATGHSATPPSVPPASAPPTTTSPPHLQTATTPRRRSGVQSSSAGTTT